MVSQQRLERIFDRPFKDDGSNYVALCPMHKEKTPSFHVHKENGLVNCFGCKIKGRITTIVKEYKGVEEKEALKLLGMTLDQVVNMEFNHIIPPKSTSYPESWLAPFTEGVHKYVIGRGFTESTIRAAEGRYDHHTKRQVFPHRSREGKLLGAIGRSCINREPRWYFYWGYEKGRYLYRTPEVSTLRSIWVVEGVFDALWLYQHGYNAVATLGSKVTKSQIEEINTHYDDIIIALDNDVAGEEGKDNLYRALKKSCRISFPYWPKEAKDIMDVDPHKLDLLNAIQTEFISTSN